ncbi:MAG: hypothetical protein CVV64_07075 [Candidatus Wallbacteria bacterium HGW-Wallbacteria-1]|jgi:hypothetical protein|uniref:Uncharacterized protein n=1 Tax=Candidatus Wallbacteria bacterium HGW-Wallbacteria-1 TaxID=2013854 RepID=A0A2N1PT46_9BACT|nr:MAG: hypothetical protein CVV64_07075 [Candidatus Wallbacteria bacterium HGW-Wallbacteria-1]
MSWHEERAMKPINNRNLTSNRKSHLEKGFRIVAGILLLVLTAITGSGCLQKGVQKNMEDRIFTFSEEDADVKSSNIKIEWAQVYGNFNEYSTSIESWHFYNFNDLGIDPDQTARDGRWTARVAVREGVVLYKFKLGGTKDGKSSDTTIFDPNNPEKAKDISNKEWSALYLQ